MQNETALVDLIAQEVPPMTPQAFEAGRRRLVKSLADNGFHRPLDAVGRWLTAHARVVSTVLVGGAVLMFVLWLSGGLIDMQVYRAGAQALVTGHPLYSQGVLGPMMFTYPPFAAIFFLPLAVIPYPILCGLWIAGNLVLLWQIVRRCTAAVGLPPQLAMVFFGLAVWLEPVRTSLALGQINLILLGLVVFDLCRRRPSKWAGIGVGLAAAIKLTPLIFVVYLLFARRWRQAGVAVATFAVTVVLGILFVPEAMHYWIGGVFGDSSRVGPVLSWSDQSIHGMLARVLGEPASGPPWLLLGGAVGLAGTAVAGAIDRRGDRVLALGLVGMTAAAVSPFSWEHHWVWFLPVVIALAARLPWYVPALVFLAAAAIPTEAPPIDFGHGMATGIISIDFEGPLAFVIRNSYPLTIMALVTALAVPLLRRRRLPA
jgi:alpha-1,2-mannosyltransferase